MKDTVECNQLLYGWAGGRTGRGYQTVAVSSGLQQEDIKYIESHPLPVSFIPGSFDSCFRKYTLPTGKIAFSFIKNAGKDEFGREGAYYAHFIVVTQEDLYYGGVSAADLTGNFLEDPDEVTYILRNFQSTLIQIPKIVIPARTQRIRIDPRKYFASEIDLAWFISALSTTRFPVVVELPENVTSQEAYLDISRIFEYLPHEYMSLPITSYSSSLKNETALFRIFLTDKGSKGRESVSIDSSVIFENGSLRKKFSDHLKEEYLFVSRMLWNMDESSLNSFLEYFNSLPDNLGIDLRFRYSHAEYTFSLNPGIDFAIYLFNGAPTREKRNYYEGKIKDLAVTPEDFEKVAAIYLKLLDDAESNEINTVLVQSLNILKYTEMAKNLSDYLENSLKIYSRLGDSFPFLEVFRLLSNEDGMPDSALSSFILSNKSACRKYVDDFLADGKSYPGFLLVEKVLEGSLGKKAVDDFVFKVYFRSLQKYNLDAGIGFLENYIDSGFFDKDVAIDIMKDLFKRNRKNSDPEISQSINDLFDKLTEMGLSQKEKDKFRKFHGEN